MLAYAMLLVVPTAAILLRDRGQLRVGEEKPQNIPNGMTAGFFSLFFLLLALRSEGCGVDLESYRWYFDQAETYSWWKMVANYQLEPGFVLLMKVVWLVGGNFRMLMVAAALLSVWPLLRFYRREAENGLLTLVLFLTVAPFSMYFSGLRQAIAMGFAFPAWECAGKRRWRPFLAAVGLAVLFHKSAFVLAVLYPLYRVKLTEKELPGMLAALGALYLGNEFLFSRLVGFLWHGGGGEITRTGDFTVLALLVLFLVYSFLLPEEERLEEGLRGMRNILLLCAGVQCFAPVNLIAMRVNYYFLPFLPVLIPKLANRSREVYRAVALVSIVVMTAFFGGFFFWKASVDADLLRVFPYVPFWKEAVL